MLPPIPSDHLIPPTLGVVSFRASYEPEGWNAQHRVAETGGYLREGRAWMRIMNWDSAPIRLACLPVLALYGGRAITYLDGWCVDA